MCGVIKSLFIFFNIKKVTQEGNMSIMSSLLEMFFCILLVYSKHQS